MTDTLSVLIADDELLARKRIRRLLEEIEGTEICGECEDGKEVLEAVRKGGIDVVLLDVQMPKLTGLDALELIADDGPMVILCTAYDEFAVQAFEGGAIDYIMKPVDAARLDKALQRARSRATSTQVDKPAKLPVPTRKGLVMIDPSDVSAALIDGESVTLHTDRGTFITDFRIADLERRLGGEPFERVHRKALLNLDRVDRLEPEETGGFTAYTKDGVQIPVSRQSARKLRRMWNLPR